MKAVNQQRYGGPEVLSIQACPAPTVGDQDVLVEVHASAVTQGDRHLRAADFPGMMFVPGRLFAGLFRPRNSTPGSNFAGRVVAVGAAVTGFSVGDEVFGSSMHGAHAELIAVPEQSPIAHKPANLSYAEAATIPYGAVTSLYFLEQLTKLKSGERLLVIGATGGVGRSLVQLGRHMGATVTGVTGRDEQLVRSLGAHEVVNYHEENFETSGRVYDVIIDTSGNKRFDDCKSALAPGGRFASMNLSVNLIMRSLFTRRSDRRALAGVAMGSPEDMRKVAALAAEGAIRANIERSFPIDEIGAAHRYLENENPRGAVVVAVRREARNTERRGPRLAAQVA